MSEGCFTFGQWVKQQRQERGWTQSQLASVCRIPQTTISGWETGKVTNICLDERLLRLAKTFSMRICELPLDLITLENSEN